MDKLPQESSDFRAKFYERYVSTFKESNKTESEGDRAEFARWSDARYLPYFFHLPKDAAILELGCGQGRMLRYLADRGYANATGIDISEEQVAIARAAGFNADRADIVEFLQGHIAQYDLIIAIDVVEHFTRSELLAMFDLIHASLRPNGTLLLQTANGEGLFPGHIVSGDLTHMTIFTPGSMEQMMKLTGFRDMDCSETNPLARGLKGIVRTIVWRLARIRANLIRKVECGKTQAIWTENFIATARKA